MNKLVRSVFSPSAKQTKSRIKICVLLKISFDNCCKAVRVCIKGERFNLRFTMSKEMGHSSTFNTVVPKTDCQFLSRVSAKW